MSYAVIFAPEALNQLEALEAFIANTRAPAVAARYTDAIVSFCESLAIFPQRGLRRDDLMPGLRTTNYRRSVVIAFMANTETKTVSILGVFYGGQDYGTIFLDDAGG